MSARKLRLLTALGTGVLVGTSLIVIIPEGVETLYNASEDSIGHDERGTALKSRRIAVLAEFPQHFQRDASWQDSFMDGYLSALATDLRSESSLTERSVNERTVAVHTLSRQDNDDEIPNEENDTDTSEEPEDNQETTKSHDPHAWVGISLIMGFILMYLIDTLPKHAIRTAQPQRFHISLNQFSFNNRTRSVSNDLPPEEIDEPQISSRPSSTTIGLVIHAAADGIALGASSTTSSSHLSFIIFIALMIHKAPAAFGLTSVLLKQGLSKRTARAHLIVFSLAAPVGALLTWFAIHLMGFSSSLGESASTEFVTGVLLLFSGGTFLYVAMHTMQESGATGHDHSANNGMNGHTGVPSSNVYRGAPPPVLTQSQNPVLLDTLITVGGMLLPLVTQFGHVH